MAAVTTTRPRRRSTSCARRRRFYKVGESVLPDFTSRHLSGNATCEARRGASPLDTAPVGGNLHGPRRRAATGTTNTVIHCGFALARSTQRISSKVGSAVPASATAHNAGAIFSSSPKESCTRSRLARLGETTARGGRRRRHPTTTSASTRVARPPVNYNSDYGLAPAPTALLTVGAARSLPAQSRWRGHACG